MTPLNSNYPPFLLYYFFACTTSLVILETVVPTRILCLACNYATEFENQEINSSQENVDLCAFVTGMVQVMVSQASHEDMANQYLDDLQSGNWERLGSRLLQSVLPNQLTIPKHILCISLHIYGSSYPQSMHITLVLVASTFLFLLAFSILEGSNWQQ